MKSKLRMPTDDALYRMLRDGNIDDFNQAIAQGQRSDLTYCDFRGVDLRGLVPDGLDLSGCYFRQADLRGIDFTHCNLQGASLNGAKISGTLFPPQLEASEIELSLLHGTRMRYQPI